MTASGSLGPAVQEALVGHFSFWESQFGLISITCNQES